MLGRIEILERLAELRSNGALTEEEYQQEKSRLLASTSENVAAAEAPIHAEHSSIHPQSEPEEFGSADYSQENLDQPVDFKWFSPLGFGALCAMFMAFYIAKYGVPDLPFVDRTQVLESDPQMVRAIKAQYSSAVAKKDDVGSCMAAGIIANMYANAEDSSNASFWSKTQEEVCLKIPGAKEMQELDKELRYFPAQ